MVQPPRAIVSMGLPLAVRRRSSKWHCERRADRGEIGVWAPTLRTGADEEEIRRGRACAPRGSAATTEETVTPCPRGVPLSASTWREIGGDVSEVHADERWRGGVERGPPGRPP